MNIKGIFFFIWVFTMLSPLLAVGQSDCQLKIEKDSIKVYLCKTDNSRFKAVKSVFTVKARLSQLVAMVQDIDYHKEWQYKALDSYLVEKVNDRELIYYNSIEVPVVANRDFVIRLTIDQNPKTRELIIDMVSVPTFIPEKKDFLRVPYSNARWIVKPITHTLLQVEYYIEIDPGGSVPPMLVNLLSDKAPYETFKSLRKKIGKYRNSRVPFIKD